MPTQLSDIEGFRFSRTLEVYFRSCIYVRMYYMCGVYSKTNKIPPRGDNYANYKQSKETRNRSNCLR
jgi:hypothetical protein